MEHVTVKDRPRSGLGHLTVCRVDAGGVLAEWVEATTATPDQLTVVWFRDGADPSVSLDASRPVAGELPRATGARVLTVACRGRSRPLSPTAVEDGIAAYVWLLGEGSETALTCFVADHGTEALAHEVLRAARERQLPLPRGGVVRSRPLQRRGP